MNIHTPHTYYSHIPKASFVPVYQNICPFPAPQKPIFRFIDLFAGVGGFRLALQNMGGECVFSSEWDKHAGETYFTNYGEYPFGDITDDKVKASIPEEFDILCGGFPCQAFSIAGYQKGFADIRGTLFLLCNSKRLISIDVTD